VKSIYVNIETKPRRRLDFEQVGLRGFFCSKELINKVFTYFPVWKNKGLNRRKSMKKHAWIVLAGTLVLGLFAAMANAQALDREALKAEIKEELKEELSNEGGLLAGIQDRIHLSGLIEFGGVWQDIDHKRGRGGAKEDESDLTLTTVELGMEAEVNDWVNVDVLLLYEDPTFGEETSVDLDEATLTIGNTEKFPLYLSVGAMYVPFGALLTHFPDDPLIDVPLTLLLGETREKAALLGVEYQGFSLSAYAFNGDMDEAEQDNEVETYGLDANYSFDDKGFDVLIGASYISNIADSDGLTEALEDDDRHGGPDTGLDEVRNNINGFDAYLHAGYAGFFLDAEYMTALDRFEANELAEGFGRAEPEVWNIEVGYNLDWGKNLEIAFKYAGSDEAEALGYPEKRYGIALNQEVFEGVIVSVASLYDEYEKRDIDGRDDRRTVYGQVAIEF
jgi:hypothetical protein